MGSILVLDDEVAVRRAVAEPLRRRGHLVTEAANTSDGLKLALEIKPDLIISDVCMDDGDGLSLLKRIRSNPSIATIPFIVMTAHPDSEGMMAGAEAAADAYLPKPFPIQTLLATVENRLGREESLRQGANEIKEQLQRILEASPDLIGIIEPKSLRFLFLNAAGRRMLELPELVEITNTELSGIHPPQAFSRLQDEAIPRALAHGIWSGENVMVSARGRRIPVKQFVQGHRDPQGGVAFLSTIAHDLTEHKQAENALRESEAKFRSLVNSLPDAVLMHDGTGRILFSNARAEQLFGFSAAEFQEKFVLSIYSNSQNPGATAPTERLCIRKNGEEFPAEVRTSQFEINAEINQLTIVHDLSARKKLERERDHIELQLRQALKLESIGQLAAGIAHEINTPTQYIGDNTRFLQDSFLSLARLLPRYQSLLLAAKEGKVTPELVQEIEEAAADADLSYIMREIPQAIQQSLEGVDRVTCIVRAMKDFSHPGVTEKTLVDINHAIESTVTVARNEWKYVAQLETRFDPNLPLVPCLPGEFNQVILNLIINAAHAIAGVVGDGNEKKGTITVSTAHAADSAEIRIADTGTGIPEAIRGRIFEPFFTTKEVGKGTGQGLAIARSVVVDKHGGTIDFESEPGRGTTFIIRLPLADSAH